MSDLFHEKIELAYIQKVFSVMERGALASIPSPDETGGAARKI